MSHEVETMAYAGEKPWHGLGKEVSHELTPKEMLVEAGLDWTVSKRPLRTTMQPVIHGEEQEFQLPVIDQFALVRDTDNRILGPCGPKYTPLQNVEAFDFFQRFTEAGGMKMETAGSLNEGEQVWALANLGESFELTGHDEVGGFLLLSHPHKWGKAMVMKFTPIRVVCNNTLTMAMDTQSTGNRDNFRMPHTQAMSEDVIKAAEKAMGLASTQLAIFKEVATVLSKKKCTEQQRRLFLGRLFDAPKHAEIERDMFLGAKKDMTVMEAQAMSAKIEMSLDDASRTVNDIYQYVDQSPGSNMKSAKGTWWGALNGVTYAIDHKLGRSTNNRLDRAWFGDRAAKKLQAVALATEMAV